MNNEHQNVHVVYKQEYLNMMLLLGLWSKHWHDNSPKPMKKTHWHDKFITAKSVTWPISSFIYTHFIIHSLQSSTHLRALLKCRQPEISPATKPFSPVISGYSRLELTQSIARSPPTIAGAPPTNFLTESPDICRVHSVTPFNDISPTRNDYFGPFP